MFGGEASLGKTGLQEEEKGWEWGKASGEAEFAFGRGEHPDHSKQKHSALKA